MHIQNQYKKLKIKIHINNKDNKELFYRIEPVRFKKYFDFLAFLTLSPARIRNESMTCSAVSVSVDSLVIKSKKASKVT